MNRKVQIGISAAVVGAGGLLTSVSLLHRWSQQAWRTGAASMPDATLPSAACLIVLLSGLLVLLDAWERSDPS